MQIANPLYDTVFKYLLDDEAVAKLFLSELLGREIVELTYDVKELLAAKRGNGDGSETEHTHSPFFSILHLDFGAKVRYELRGNEKSTETLPEFEQILIEVQKTNHFSDSLRFRRYLGLQYSSKHNATRGADGKTTPIPIYPIYFLGEGLTDIKGHGIIHIRRQLRDGETLTIIPERSEFIDAISHDGMVICMNELKSAQELTDAASHTNTTRLREGILELLSIFKLAAAFKYEHFLTIDETSYAERYHPIIRRLQKAAETATVQKSMDDEDDYLDQFVSIEKQLVLSQEEVATERAAKEAAEQASPPNAARKKKQKHKPHNSVPCW